MVFHSYIAGLKMLKCRASCAMISAEKILQNEAVGLCRLNECYIKHIQTGKFFYTSY